MKSCNLCAKVLVLKNIILAFPLLSELCKINAYAFTHVSVLYLCMKKNILIVVQSYMNKNISNKVFNGKQKKKQIKCS